jgi:hypothetical protein
MQEKGRIKMGENSALGVIAIVFAVLLLASVGIILLVAKEKRRVDSLSPAERAAHDAVMEAKRRYRDAVQEYRDRTRPAEKEYRREIASINSMIKSAQEQMDTAHATGRATLQTYRGKDGSVTLFEHQISVNGEKFHLDETISATVDTSGNLARTKRATLTRMTAGGLLLGPVGILAGGMIQKKKLHDDRELYLMVEGREFTALVTCYPDHGVTVRQFAARISQACKSVEMMNTRRENAVELASKNLDQVMARAQQSRAIAESHIADVRAENGGVTAAGERLRELGEAPKGFA